jgi:hypothetical protein
VLGSLPHCKRRCNKKYFCEAYNTLQTPHCSIVKIFIEKAQVIHNVTYETPYLSFKILTFKRINVPQDLPYVPFLNLTMS